MSSRARTAATIALSVGVGALLGRWSRSEPAAPSGTIVAPAPSTTTEALCAASPDIPPSQVTSAPTADLPTRARAGDLEALKSLDDESPAARDASEAVALYEGHGVLARRDAEAFVRDVAAEPKLLEDRATLAYGYRLALDDAAAPALLAGLSSVDAPVVPDLLFDLATRGEPGARLTILARDLLEVGAVRARASKALSVSLALEAARDCGTALALLPRVEADADDRATSELERLHAERGCGPKGTDDCMPCLREPIGRAALERATQAARERPFERGWTVAKGKR